MMLLFLWRRRGHLDPCSLLCFSVHAERRNAL